MDNGLIIKCITCKKEYYILQWRDITCDCGKEFVKIIDNGVHLIGDISIRGTKGNNTKLKNKGENI